MALIENIFKAEVCRMLGASYPDMVKELEDEYADYDPNTGELSGNRHPLQGTETPSH